MKRYLLLIVLLLIAFTGSAQSTAEKSDGQEIPTVIQHKVKVFPNPATNVVNVLGLKNTSKADINILDIYGNVVSAYSWEIRRNAINIPISTLDSGAYIITVLSDEQQVRTKFYKQ